MKKSILILVLMFVSAFAYADSIYTVWNNASGDGKWSTAGNWTEGIPTTGYFASIGLVSDLCVIDTTVSADGFVLGVVPGSQANLLIDANGTLTVPGQPVSSTLALVEGTGNVVANLTVEGALIVDWQLAVGGWGFANIDIKNGGSIQVGVLYFNIGTISNAKINIIDGTLQVDYQLSYNPASFGGFVIDILDGEFLIDNTVLSEASAGQWVDLGFVTGYGEYGNIAVDTVSVGGIDYTRMRASCKMFASDGDLIRDCNINLLDFAKMADNWLDTGN